MLRQGPNVPADVLDGSPAPLRHQHWHRDYPHALGRPMRAGYLHMLCCAPPARPLLSDLRVSPFARADLTDVDDTTPCMSISPEPVSGPILPPEEQIATRGIVDLVFLVSTGSFAG